MANETNNIQPGTIAPQVQVQQVEVQEEKSISLKDIFRIIKKHLIAICVFIALGIAGGFTFNALEAPEYVAPCSLMAMPETTSESTSSAYNGMSMIANTFVSFISEDVVLNEAVEDLKVTYPDVTKKEIRNSLSVTNKNLIINVKYYASEGKKAQDYVKAVVDNAVEIANRVDTLGQPVYKLLYGNLQILSDNEAATRNSHTMKNVLIGGAIGLAVAILYTCIFELFDNSFKNSEDVEATLRLPILGSIPFYDIENDKSSKNGGNK